MHAWFSKCDKFLAYAELLGEPKHVEGPFADEDRWLMHGLDGGDYRLHEVRIRSTKQCRFVVSAPKLRNPLLVRLCGWYLNDEYMLEAYLHPASAAYALGYPDWFGEGPGLPWSMNMGHQAHYALYQALIEWWIQLTQFSTCSALWLGYEDYLNDDPTVYERYTRRFITHPSIAQLMAPGRHAPAGQHFAGIRWDDLHI